MDINILTLLLMGLSAWRLASLLSNEHGPYRILERIRFRLGVHYIVPDGKVAQNFQEYRAFSELDTEIAQRVATTELAKLITCTWCSSPWIGLLLTIMIRLTGHLSYWVLLPLSVSAVAIIIDRHVDK